MIFFFCKKLFPQNIQEIALNFLKNSSCMHINFLSLVKILKFRRVKLFNSKDKMDTLKYFNCLLPKKGKDCLFLEYLYYLIFHWNNFLPVPIWENFSPQRSPKQWVCEHAIWPWISGFWTNLSLYPLSPSPFSKQTSPMLHLPRESVSLKNARGRPSPIIAPANPSSKGKTRAWRSKEHPLLGEFSPGPTPTAQSEFQHSSTHSVSHPRCTTRGRLWLGLETMKADQKTARL